MRWATRSIDLSAAVEPHVEIFAIGDVHGASGLFRKMLTLIGKVPRAKKRRQLVLLGDLVDRGFDSLGVLDLARKAHELAGADVLVPLMGNHEMMLLVAAAGTRGPQQEQTRRMWRDNGGDRLLKEAGLTAEASAHWLRTALGSRLDFLVTMGTSYRSGGVSFVHAGLRSTAVAPCLAAPDWDIPYSALVHIMPGHPLWMSPKSMTIPEGELVVHGHEYTDLSRAQGTIHGPVVGADLARTTTVRRINLDVGAPFSKRLRAARFHGSTADVFDLVA